MQKSISQWGRLNGLSLVGLVAASISLFGMSASGNAAGSEPGETRTCMLTTFGGSNNNVSTKGLRAAYDCFRPGLLAGYAQSKHIIARTFGSWRTVDRTPFVYDEIGNRFLVAYANDRALGIDKTNMLDRGIPVGGTVALAGFSVGADGSLQAEPLVLYEKMQKGFRTGRGGWRQTHIAPSGEIIGVTHGPGSENITLCSDCGARSADRLYLTLLNGGITPHGAPEPSDPVTGEVKLFADKETRANDTLSARLDPLPSSDTDISIQALPSSVDAPTLKEFDPNPVGNQVSGNKISGVDPDSTVQPLALVEPALVEPASVESTDLPEHAPVPSVSQESGLVLITPPEEAPVIKPDFDTELALTSDPLLSQSNTYTEDPSPSLAPEISEN